jgi:hypothetical protein
MRDKWKYYSMSQQHFIDFYTTHNVDCVLCSARQYQHMKGSFTCSVGLLLMPSAASMQH